MSSFAFNNTDYLKVVTVNAKGLSYGMFTRKKLAPAAEGKEPKSEGPKKAAKKKAAKKKSAKKTGAKKSIKPAKTGKA